MSDALYPSDRLRLAQQATAAAGLDALLLTPGADLRYLTGYAAHALERLTCLVLPADGDPVLVVPALEEAAAQASPAGGIDLDIRPFPEGDDAYALIRGLLGDGPRRLGLADRMWAEQVLAFRAAFPGAEQVLAGNVLRPLRVRKSPAEVEALRRAGQAIDRVHARMGEWLIAGRTEAAVGRDIADAILAEGHAQVSFVIVGSGPNGASPHHAVSDRVIEDGDPVVVDIGGVTAEGYCSDSTRTYVLGVPPEGFATAYAVLQEAQEAGVAAVKPGVTAESVDAACRDVLTAAGYGDAFIHRTGHGIGLEEHEEPWIIGGNRTVLEPGMAFSVEPGFYLAGRYGARIEDIVVCGENGPDRLNVTPRTLALL
ncbi:M24 family metallopeptidase [Cryptosporangium aurantiacum]|uniref:Xaa-Pro aminopeptidase n=1 Tax=Cryptosporangium aurantiacum TaxID=134849 RepID=A0A1M7RIN5_9ACTN|nr:Xaa-Pro peptidase family protein [Cryptosporangium aurantiacum]SHN46040.1 Xaa-Pro aminopeptidase [Cryptosporangium aurantiacum]